MDKEIKTVYNIIKILLFLLMIYINKLKGIKIIRNTTNNAKYAAKLKKP
jgi:hypothetical protein